MMMKNSGSNNPKNISKTTDRNAISPTQLAPTPVYLCDSSRISGKILSSSNSLTISVKAKNNRIKSFIYVISDRDKNPPSKFINRPFHSDYLFRPSYFFFQDSSSSDKNSATVFYDKVKNALNFDVLNPPHLQAAVYLVDNEDNYSFADPKCIVNFDVE